MRRLAALALALLALAPAGVAEGPRSVNAASDDCVTLLLVAWGPRVPGACAASVQATLDPECAAACTLHVTGTAAGRSALPAGAGVLGWVVHGDLAPCAYVVGVFAYGLPPCGAGSHYSYLCSAVVELAGSASCAGSLDVDLATPPAGCTAFIVGATGYGRLRVPPSPSGPPFTVLVYDSAFAQGRFALVRAADGTPVIAAGAC